jgi:hypothetical protein
VRVPLICTTCLHRIGMRNDCSATADDVPGCWESDGTDSGTQRLRGDVTPRPFDPQRIVCTVPMHPWRYSLALVEVAPPVGWRLSPATNRPALPVNDKRSEG